MEDIELLEAMRTKGDEDFFFFASEICEFGYNAEPEGPRMTEDQRELAAWLQAIYEAKAKGLPIDWLHLILAPRDTLKSTVLQAFALWIAIKNPDVRMLFYGEVHEQAQKRIAVIKRVIESGETFRSVYGDLDGSKLGYAWNEDMATVSTRKNVSIRENTFETAGLDVVINARHFDWIFPDDLQSEKNTKSREQTADVQEKVRLLIPLLAKDGHMVFAGVFWNDSDIHTWLIQEHNADVFRRSAYKDKEHTIAAYPNALPLAVLSKKASFLTTDQFAGHYLLDPVSKTAQRFKKEWFGIIADRDFESVRTFLLIDPAGDPLIKGGLKADSDYYGMVVVGANLSLDLLIRQMVMERFGPTEAIEAALSLIMRYNPYVIGIEKTGLGNMRYYLAEAIRKRGKYAIIEDLKPANRSKYSRVISVEPLARLRKIFLATETNHKDEFFEQILKVTTDIKSKFDDLIDPLAYILDLLKMYGVTGEASTEAIIPPELRNLDPVSRDYWMSVRRAAAQKKNENWTQEFVQ